MTNFHGIWLQVHTGDPFEEANVIRKAHRIKVRWDESASCRGMCNRRVVGRALYLHAALAKHSMVCVQQCS